ncbi:MAG TPA: DEAD/DEAH box helicase [Solirubrobacteraceae bacterium]
MSQTAGITREIEPWTALLDQARSDQRLVGEAFEFAREARTVELPDDLHPELLDALRTAGIERLYSHQFQALEAATDGPVIVTTGTASGKSLCFNLPTLDVLMRDPLARALYLYPTKALAQDQARAINSLGLARFIRPAIYDGDTPRESRGEIRKRSNLIFTNPDMLHVGILPHHPGWAALLSNLAVVVVDEAHTYRGVFGSHVANVLLRLRRLAAAYGTTPRFLLASATIANPLELAERLTGLDGFTLIEEDGSPSAGRRIAVWNPPLTDEVLGLRRSPLGEGAELLAELVAAGARTICFVRSRRGVELVTRIAREELERLGAGELGELVMPYRAGYTPEQRREIEAKLSSGALRAVVTTDALELGIDVGTLDAAVVVTFPGTIASLRQMWGRAGRRRRGLAVYVAGVDALDQFFARHTDDFLDRRVESAILDHESEEIHLAHLLCAAHEGPLTQDDAVFFGPRTLAYLERLEGLGELRCRDGRFVLRARERYPAAEVSLRSASPDSYAIVDAQSGEVIGTTEAARAFSTLHPGAVYLHMGRSFHVRDLDVDARRALVEPFEEDWYTQPKRETDTQIERLLDRREALGVTLSFGRVLVTDTVLAYQRRRLSDHSEIDLTALELPSTRFATQAIWFELDAALLAGFPVDLLLGSLHAAEHAQIAVLPLLAMCDRWDIGGLSTNAHPQTGGPTIFIHDGHPGGVGITRIAFARFEELVGDAHRLIAECPCRDGCPSCVQSPKCGNLNEPLAKAGAGELLERMLTLGA